MDVRTQLQSLIRLKHTNTTLAASAGISLTAANRLRFMPPGRMHYETVEKLAAACGYALRLVKLPESES